MRSTQTVLDRIEHGDPENPPKHKIYRQVNEDHYTFETYTIPARWVSYYEQLRVIYQCSPKNILEIGVGDRTVANHVGSRGIDYRSLDIVEELRPDRVGSVTDIPYPDQSFDMVVAFQILEHLPFSQFDVAVNQLVRVARRYVAISLPHYGPMIKFLLKIPLVPEFKFGVKLPYPKVHHFDGEHYWEIGTRGYSRKRIRSHLQRHGRLRKEWSPFGHLFHRFYLLEKP